MQNLKMGTTISEQDSWTHYFLKDCVDILDNKRIPVNSDERNKRVGSIPYYGATGQVGVIDDYIFDEELVLLGEDGAPFLDKSKSIAYIISGKSWVNNHAHVLRAKKEIAKNWFIKYYLDYFDYSEFVAGTTRLKLTQSAMRDIPIRLPSLSEQEKIIEEINHLLGNGNNAKQKIRKAKGILSKFRQAVLTAAITGRLTEHWRENNKNLVDASQIVKKIEDKRLSEVKTVANKNKISEIYEHQETNDDNVLPEGWKYVSLDKLCESFQYGTSAKSQPEGSVPVLRMGNLQDVEIDWTDLVFTSDEKEIEKYKLKKGDVLFNRTNSPELVGKTSIYRGEREAIFAGYLIKINNYLELNSEFLNYCLNSHYARVYCNQVKTDGVSQSNINAQKLGKFEIPYCSLEEQEEIVRKVDYYFRLASQVERQIGKAETKVSKLTQAILAKTFRQYEDK